MAVLAFIQGGVSAQETIIGIPEALISCLTKIFNHRPNIHVILASIPHLFLDDMSSSSDLTKVRACVRACVCASGRPAGRPLGLSSLPCFFPLSRRTVFDLFDALNQYRHTMFC